MIKLKNKYFNILTIINKKYSKMAEHSNVIHLNYKEFDAKYNELKQQGKPFAVLFTGDNVPGTTDSWCGDCVRAHPVIQSTVIPKCAELHIPFLEVLVGLREEWKTPTHLIRNHPDLMLTNIPTLLLNEKGKFTKKLVEGQILNKSLLEDFFELDD
ncbi:hypothetical protein ABPG74_008079 [Tetrahymena malaccensis]